MHRLEHAVLIQLQMRLPGDMFGVIVLEAEAASHLGQQAIGGGIAFFQGLGAGIAVDQRRQAARGLVGQAMKQLNARRRFAVRLSVWGSSDSEL